MKEIISLPEDLTLDQSTRFYEMLLKNSDVLSKGDVDVGIADIAPLKIKLYDETPIRQRPRRFAEPLTEEIEKQ